MPFAVRNDEFRVRTAEKAAVVLPESACLNLNKSPAGTVQVFCSCGSPYRGQLTMMLKIIVPRAIAQQSVMFIYALDHLKHVQQGHPRTLSVLNCETCTFRVPCK